MDDSFHGLTSGLSPEDKITYKRLKETVSHLESFQDMLNAIQSFVVQNNEGDHIRARACGICWLSDTVAVNLTSLQFLIGKAGSMLNTGFERIGLRRVFPNEALKSELLSYVPGLDMNFGEVRQWTFRKLNTTSPDPANIRDDMAACLHRSTIPKPRLHLAPAVSRKRINRWSYEDYSLNQIGEISVSEDSFTNDSFCCTPADWGNY